MLLEEKAPWVGKALAYGASVAGLKAYGSLHHPLEGQVTCGCLLKGRYVTGKSGPHVLSGSEQVCLELCCYAKNISPGTHTSLGAQIPGLPEPTDRNSKAKTWFQSGPWQPELGTRR